MQKRKESSVVAKAISTVLLLYPGLGLALKASEEEKQPTGGLHGLLSEEEGVFEFRPL